MKDFDPLPLPPGIRSRFIEGINGLRMHVLESGFEAPGRPLVLLLHGFPELAYSWRKVMPAIAAAGYHVIAPDQRGYGRTTGWNGDYDGDLAPFRMMNLVKDALALVFALGHRSVHALVGHDFGSFVAAWSALIRPDVYRSVTLMSAPFAGPPPLPMPVPASDIHRDLAALKRPRKHYQWYYSTRDAEPDMLHAPQGLHAFFRAYYHHKSADWKQNQPFPLKAWTATELEKMPTYYIMDLAEDMAQTVAREMPTSAEVAANKWMPENEMAVYAGEFARTGFQGSLNWYRCMTSPAFISELQVFAGRTIDIPSCFIAGRSDWGIYQRPGGDMIKMQKDVLTRMTGGCHVIDGAGHWVQQEQPDEVIRLLLAFIDKANPGARAT